MNLDDRGRRAADDLRRDVGDPAGTFGGDPLERFDRTLERRRRNQRVATVAVATGLVVLSIVFLGRAFWPGEDPVPAATLPAGTILYGEWDEAISQAHWYVASSDGSDRLL